MGGKRSVAARAKGPCRNLEADIQSGAQARPSLEISIGEYLNLLGPEL